MAPTLPGRLRHQYSELIRPIASGRNMLTRKGVEAFAAALTRSDATDVVASYIA